MNLEGKKLFFVINPVSGNKNKEDFLTSLHSFCNRKQVLKHIFFTTGKDDETLLRSEIEFNKPDIILAVGGDGTLNLVVRIVGHSIPIVIVPFGSGNGMATELNLGKDPMTVLDQMEHFQEKEVDLLRINQKYYSIHLSDIGLNAKIIWRTTIEKKKGFWSYVKHFFKEVFYTLHYRFTILFDDQYLKRRAIMIAFANGTRYGTGAILNPKGSLSDEKFEICIIKPFPWYYWLLLTFQIFNGNLDNSKYVEIHSCRSATVNFRKKKILQIDGELIGPVNKVTVDIIPSAVKILVPAVSINA